MSAISLCVAQEKLARDENHRNIRQVIKDLVDECLKRPPSNEDANSIAGRQKTPFCTLLGFMIMHFESAYPAKTSD